MSQPLENVSYPGESKLGASLTLLPVSPREVLATWCVPADGQASVEEQAATGSQPGEGKTSGSSSSSTAKSSKKPRRRRFCVRIEEVVGEEDEARARAWTREIELGDSGCVIDLEQAGVAVRGELIRKLPAGREQAVAQSRRIQLPPDEAPANHEQVQWVAYEGNGHH